MSELNEDEFAAWVEANYWHDSRDDVSLASMKLDGGGMATRIAVLRHFGDVLRHARMAAGRSLGDVARHLGIGLVTMSSVERGSTLIGDDLVRQIAEFLEVDAAAFLQAAAKDRKRWDTVEGLARIGEGFGHG